MNAMEMVHLLKDDDAEEKEFLVRGDLLQDLLCCYFEVHFGKYLNLQE